jgi:hypothetical protein
MIRGLKLSNNQSELIQEVLHRANKAEKQQYKEIIERKLEISKRASEISHEQEVLSERDKINLLPERPSTTYHAPDKSNKEIMGMSSGDLHEWTQQVVKETEEYNYNSKKYNEELEVYRAKNSVLMKERMKLIEESLALKIEFDALEKKEKWLLLSIAIRSQPNLLTFIQKEDSHTKV